MLAYRELGNWTVSTELLLSFFLTAPLILNTLELIIVTALLLLLLFHQHQDDLQDDLHLSANMLLLAVLLQPQWLK